jgi:hypothetical protein
MPIPPGALRQQPLAECGAATPSQQTWFSIVKFAAMALLLGNAQTNTRPRKGHGPACGVLADMPVLFALLQGMLLQ